MNISVAGAHTGRSRDAAAKGRAVAEVEADRRRWVALIGGPNDGEVYRVDLRKRLDLYMPTFKPARYDPVPGGRVSLSRHVEVYRQEWISYPDGWIQPCFVHSSISREDMFRLGEAHLIRAAVLPWRAEHREAAK